MIEKLTRSYPGHTPSLVEKACVDNQIEYGKRLAEPNYPTDSEIKTLEVEDIKDKAIEMIGFGPMEVESSWLEWMVDSDCHYDTYGLRLLGDKFGFDNTKLATEVIQWCNERGYIIDFCYEGDPDLFDVVIPYEHLHDYQRDYEDSPWIKMEKFKDWTPSDVQIRNLENSDDIIYGWDTKIHTLFSRGHMAISIVSSDRSHGVRCRYVSLISVINDLLGKE